MTLTGSIFGSEFRPPNGPAPKTHRGVAALIRVIPPEQFRKIPWKNGQGSTLELAMSPGGTLDRFDWRISIASVVKDGAFSQFSGYDRHLVLLSGAGIELQHADQSVDNLHSPLSLAVFDGGRATTAKLKQGPIEDFNVMTRSGRYHARLNIAIERQNVALEKADRCFIFSPNRVLEIYSPTDLFHRKIAPGQLVHIEEYTHQALRVFGENMLIIYLAAVC